VILCTVISLMQFRESERPRGKAVPSSQPLRRVVSGQGASIRNTWPDDCFRMLASESGSSSVLQAGGALDTVNPDSLEHAFSDLLHALGYAPNRAWTRARAFENQGSGVPCSRSLFGFAIRLLSASYKKGTAALVGCRDVWPNHRTKSRWAGKPAIPVAANTARSTARETTSAATEPMVVRSAWI
jgi:hypothetical protein